MNRQLLRCVAVLLALLLCASPGGTVLAQQPPPTTGTGSQTGSATQPPPGTPAVQLPQSQLDRIKEAVLNDPKLQLQGERLKFYLTIEAKRPTVKDMLGTYDLKYGPTKGGPPGGAALHQEYLGMVTPRELYGSGGIRAYELLQGALVNMLAQLLIRKGVEELREARTEREIQEIRDRIDRELAALRGGGS